MICQKDQDGKPKNYNKKDINSKYNKQVKKTIRELESIMEKFDSNPDLKSVQVLVLAELKDEYPKK